MKFWNIAAGGIRTAPSSVGSRLLSYFSYFLLVLCKCLVDFQWKGPIWTGGTQRYIVPSKCPVSQTLATAWALIFNRTLNEAPKVSRALLPPKKKRKSKVQKEEEKEKEKKKSQKRKKEKSLLHLKTQAQVKPSLPHFEKEALVKHPGKNFKIKRSLTYSTLGKEDQVKPSLPPWEWGSGTT